MLQIINVQKILINNDLLSSKQKKKIYANKNINDRKLSYASELFKFNLAKKNKININTLVNIKKPHFKNSNVHFSISHSFPYFVAISSLNHKVGIDIEKIQPVKYFDISKRLYNDYENSILLKSRNKLEMFYKIWTMKESLYKCIYPKSIKFITLKYKNNSFSNKYFSVGFKKIKQYLIAICKENKFN